MTTPLLDLVPNLRKIATTHGGEYAGPCPLCGGREELMPAPPIEKKCSRCRRLMPVSQFHRDKAKSDGFYSICKECRSGRQSAPHVPSGYRICRRCDQVKPVADYYPAHHGVERQTCIECCESRWKKSYQRKTHRIANGKLSLLGWLTPSARRMVRRSNSEVRDRDRAADRRYKQSPKGQLKRQAWVVANRDRLRNYQHKRRARLTDATFSIEDWQATLELFGHQCAYCQVTGVDLHQDHFIPIARGGTHTLGNVVPSCRRCNSRKRDSMPQDFCSPDTYHRIAQALKGGRP